MLVLDPEVLILDEPTSGQDRRNVENLMHLLREKTENELTIIIITHDLDLVGRFATDVLAMENGKVAFDGKPGKLFRQIEDEGLPQALESPDTYRFVRKLQELDLDPPDAYCPEDFLRSLAPSSSAQSGATRR
jgi:energy-coupling factor transport system ATP-binding protein